MDLFPSRYQYNTLLAEYWINYPKENTLYALIIKIFNDTPEETFYTELDSLSYRKGLIYFSHLWWDVISGISIRCQWC